MSGPLRGAWSLTGEPLDRVLTEDEKAFIGGAARRSPRLWLAGGRLVEQDGRVLAWEGVFADPKAREPRALLHGDLKVDGHFCAVWADEKAGRLALERDATGGERLFYRRRGPALLFSSSGSALAGPRPSLNEDLDNERRLGELALFGRATLWQGVEEVLAGHRYEDGVQRWQWPGLLDARRGEVGAEAEGLRAALAGAVSAAVAGRGRVAVSLSGGIDSLAVAHYAVQSLGAENVEGFTYEYDHPSSVSEAPLAAAFCKRLGMRHHVLKLSREDHLDSIPEMIRLTEEPSNYRKAYTLKLARAVAERGLSACLTGDGVGSRMAWFELTGPVFDGAPRPDLWLRYWKSGVLGASWARWPGRVHPVFGVPLPFLYFQVLALLHARGRLDLAEFYPESRRELVIRAVSSPRLAEDAAATARLPFSEAIKLLAFSHLSSSVDVTRTEPMFRKLGVARLSPAAFPSCLPYLYLPLLPGAAPWSRDGRLPPGKRQLERAMQGVLAPEEAGREKDWLQALPPADWNPFRHTGMKLAPSVRELRLAECPEDIRRNFLYGNAAMLAQWKQLFL